MLRQPTGPDGTPGFALERHTPNLSVNVDEEVAETKKRLDDSSEANNNATDGEVENDVGDINDGDGNAGYEKYPLSSVSQRQVTEMNEQVEALSVS